MLSGARLHTTLPVEDLERAKRFYFEKLGLEPIEETPGGVFYECSDGTRFHLFPTAGKASGTHTQMGFRVEDIESEVADLRSRGVEFEEYETPKTENGIADTGRAKAAWFKDSEGNLIGVVQLAA